MNATATLQADPAARVAPTLSAVVVAAWEARQPGRFDSWDMLVEASRRQVVEALEAGSADAVPAGFVDAAVALLLTHGWQYARQDIAQRGRVTVPADVAGRHGLSLGLLVAAVGAGVARGDDCGCVNIPSAGISALLPAYRRAMADLVSRTHALLDEADALPAQLAGDARHDARLAVMRGQAVLRAIERRGCDTLTGPVEIGRWTGMALRLRARWGG